MSHNLFVDIVVFLIYVGVIIALLVGKSMLSMYLMGIGMVIDSAFCLIADFKARR